MAGLRAGQANANRANHQAAGAAQRKRPAVHLCCMNCWYWLIAMGLLAGGPVAGQAQAPAINGLKGDYYDGVDFDTFVATRRDATIDFTAGQRPSGIPYEYFSVRWTGWLRPPVTGRYVLHVVVDDGMRLWLDGRPLLDEWRGQPLSQYDVPVTLQAGRTYALRVDYCQYSRDNRALLAWQLPNDPAAEPASWRNLWGATSDGATPQTIPTRYLYAVNPNSPAPRPPAATAPPARPAAAGPPRKMAVQLKPVVVRPLRPVGRSAPVPRPPAPRPPVPRLASVAEQLAGGQAVTMRALYFEQGKAELPLPVQASLDTLAVALRQQPTLRLEVQGHTDNQGDTALNQQLSQRRAEAVCAYLATHGVAANRLRPVGYGGSQPVADNGVPANRPRNRRVVLKPL